MQDKSTSWLEAFRAALLAKDFGGEIEADSALRAAMSTDNSVYQIYPDVVVAPRTAGDVVALLDVMAQPEFAQLALTPRGGGTGTNGQSLNQGVILDFRRHMNKLIAVNEAERWADVEPGMVLDTLNDQLRPLGLFFAPEASTSTRCTIGGMVSTDASGKGSRIYGKTSDNIAGLEIACPQGLLASFNPDPDWARPMLDTAEQAARSGRDAFIANTPKINRRFTGYDLERACPEEGAFEWWRLFLGAEGTLSPITRIRVQLRPLPKEKRLIVASFESFRAALAAATPLMDDEPTAIEVMDERVQQLAEEAGILNRLPDALRPRGELLRLMSFWNSTATMPSCWRRVLLRAVPVFSRWKAMLPSIWQRIVMRSVSFGPFVPLALDCWARWMVGPAPSPLSRIASFPPTK